MRHRLIDDHIRHEFRSILIILMHFSVSLTQLLSVLIILGLQIALTVTQTCAYRFGIGFWSFPFLIISPFSIWLVMWRRTSMTCLIAILIHFCSTLFATGIIILSVLVLLGPIGFTCPKSSINESYIILNSALIGMSSFYKLFNYGEFILLYLLIRNNNKSPTRYIDEFLERDLSFVTKPINVNVWRSWSAISSETHSNSDIFFA